MSRPTRKFRLDCTLGVRQGSQGQFFSIRTDGHEYLQDQAGNLPSHHGGDIHRHDVGSVGRAGLSESSDQDHRAVPGRNDSGHHPAHRGGQAFGPLGPADHRREPSRRDRQYRRRAGGQGRSGRVHAAVLGAAAARYQPEPLSQARFRSSGVHRHLADDGGAECAGREPECSRQHAGGADRAREVETERAHLWLDRTRRYAATHYGDAQARQRGEL
jgi:hypothetical protein